MVIIVKVFEGVDEIVVVVFANIFDAEDVDYKAERYCLSFLVP